MKRIPALFLVVVAVATLAASCTTDEPTDQSTCYSTPSPVVVACHEYVTKR